MNPAYIIPTCAATSPDSAVEKALELATGNRSLVNRIRVGLALYHQELPFHQTPVALHVEQ